MNQDIIKLYETILLRTPVQAEIDYWLAHAESNSLQFVEDAIRASDEGVYTQTILLPIIGLYQGLLGRAPEMEGLEFWSNAIANGNLTFQDLISSFAISDEFQTNNPDLGMDVSPQELATLFYTNLLGRTPDPAGLQFWTSLLSDGDLTVNTFTTAFINTPETQANIGQQITDFRNDILDGKIDNPDNEGSMLPPPTPEPEPEPEPEPGPGGGNPPVDSATHKFGEVSGIAQDGVSGNIWAGSGNEADSFALLTTALSNIELGLKGYARDTNGSGTEDYITGDAKYIQENGGNHSVYTLWANENAGFVYSVASLATGVSLEALLTAGYEFTLRIDSSATGEEWSTLKLEDGGVAGLRWVNTEKPDITFMITDDNGTDFVTQNIQTPLWYGSLREDGDVKLDPGTYTVELGVSKGSMAHTNTIDLKVLEYSQTQTLDTQLDTIARGGADHMLVGSNNLADNFSVVRVSKGAGDLFELALGAQQQGEDPYSDGAQPDGTYVANHPDAQFRFSVTSLDADTDLSELIETHRIELKVDQDAGVGTDFVTLVLEKDSSSGELVWDVKGYDSAEGGNGHALTDNGNNDFVSQNIQSLSWYQEFGEGLFGPGVIGNGLYDVSLQVYEGGTLIGINTIQIEVMVPAG